MRNFKKILSIVLCMTMLLSSVLFVSATENFTTLPHKVRLQSGVEGLTGSEDTVINADGVYLVIGSSFSYEFTATTAKEYFLDLRVGCPIDTTLDIEVNGVLVADDVVPYNNGTATSTVLKTYAKIDVVEGKNTISVTRKNDEIHDQYVFISQLELSEAKNDLTTDPITILFRNGSGVVDETNSNVTFSGDWPVFYQGSYLTHNVSVTKAASYSLQLRYNTTTDGAKFDLYLNGKKTLSDLAIPNTSGATNNTNLGMIDLPVGTNTIKLVRQNDGMELPVTTIGMIFAEETIKANPTELTFNKDTGKVDTANSTVTYSWGWPIFAEGQYITHNVVAKEAGSYYLQLRYASGIENAKIDVYVNNQKVIPDVTLPNTSNAATNLGLGMVDLVAGTNVIKIARQSDAAGSTITAYNITLFAEEIETLPAIYQSNAADTVISPTDNVGIAQKTSWDVKLNQSGTLTKTIYTTEEAEYSLQLQLGGDNLVVDVYVNGVVVFDDFAVNTKDITSEGANPADAKKGYILGDITLKPGVNTIKIERPSTSAAGFVGVGKIILFSENITELPTTFAINSAAENMVLDGINTPTNHDVKINQTGSIAKTIATLEEKEYTLKINAGTGLDGMILAVSVNGQVVSSNFAMPNTTGADIKEVITIGTITLVPGANTIKIERPGSSTGGDVGIGSIILDEVVEATEGVVINGTTATATVIYDEAQTGLAIIAVYDVDDRLIGYDTLDVSALDTVVISAAFNGTANSVKVFIWNGLDACKPLVAAKTPAIQ